MPTDARTDTLSRDHLLSLLSDDELTRVSTSETAARLDDGEEYVDLADVARGVQRAPGTAHGVASVLSRRAVRETTWSRIVSRLQMDAATADE